MRKKNVRFQGKKNLLINKDYNSKFGIWEYNIKQDKLNWSDEVYSILDLNSNEFEPTFDRFFQFVHEDDREGLKKAYSKSISGSKLHRPLVHRVVGKTGSIKYVEELGFTEYEGSEAIKTTGLIRDVTKEVHVAKQLQDQHEYIESILDSLPNLIFITDENGIFLDAKAGDNDLFYQAPHDFIGKHYAEVMPPEINQLFDDSFIKLNEGIQQVKIEYELETKRGINYFEAILRRFSDQKVLVVVRDISKLKQTINRFKKIAKLQNLLVNISSSFIAIDEDNVGNQINESLRILGEFIGADRFYIFDYDFEEMTASNTFEWCAKGIEPQLEILQDIPVEDMTEWIQNHRRGEIMEYENIHVLPPNHPIRLILEPQDIKSIITMPLMDGNKCIGFIGLDYVRKYYAFSDEEKQLLKLYSQMLVSLYNRLDTYQILSENQKFLYDIINHSGSIIAQKDLDGRYKLVNKKWVEITGFSSNQALGKTDLEIFPEKTAVQFMNNDHLVLKSEKSIETEEFLETDEGIRYFIASKFPTREKTGQVSGLCAMVTEITDRKRIEEAQIQRRKSEAANQAKTEFLSRMSHEIRTPLNAILGFSELLIQSDGLSEKHKKQIYTIWKSGDHLLSLVNDILDFSKIEAGVTEINKSAFSIVELLLGLKMMFNKMAEDKGIHLAFNIPYLENEVIITDEAKLRQIIINLISNAIKFTDKGYVSLALEIEKKSDLKEESDNNYFLNLMVEDSGSGIPEDKREAIFDSFVQLEQGIKAGGTGLGLSITKKLTELLQGSISVETKPSYGSKFKIDIPVELSGKHKDFRSTQDEKDTRTDSINRYSSLGYHTQHSIDGLMIDVEILNQMENAISHGDINELNNLILRLHSLPEDLKKTIENLASNFDYRGLVILLERLKKSLNEKNLE